MIASAQKGGEETGIFAVITTLLPSESETALSGEIHHGTIGGTSNSPNASIMMNGGMGDAVISHDGQVSGIPGVTLMSSVGGFGVLTAADDNMTMYAGQRMTIVAGPSGPNASIGTAYAVLHPGKVSAAPRASATP